jgi:hypothetical protein
VYNEAHAATETGEEDTTKPKSKRKIFIRLSTAIFITLIIALIVAGVVGRIDLLETQKAEDNSMGRCV